MWELYLSACVVCMSMCVCESVFVHACMCAYVNKNVSSLELIIGFCWEHSKVINTQRFVFLPGLQLLQSNITVSQRQLQVLLTISTRTAGNLERF